jgi:hypothetical protein
MRHCSRALGSTWVTAPVRDRRGVKLYEFNTKFEFGVSRAMSAAAPTAAAASSTMTLRTRPPRPQSSRPPTPSPSSLSGQPSSPQPAPLAPGSAASTAIPINSQSSQPRVDPTSPPPPRHSTSPSPSPGSAASTAIPINSQEESCDDPSDSDDESAPAAGPTYEDSSESSDYGASRPGSSDESDSDYDDDDFESESAAGHSDSAASATVASAPAAVAVASPVGAQSSKVSASLQEAARRCLTDVFAMVKQSADTLSSASPLYPAQVHDILAAAEKADGHIYPKDNGIRPSCDINAILPKKLSNGSFSAVPAGTGLQVTVRDIRQSCDTVNICITALSYKDTDKCRIIRILGLTDYSGPAFHAEPIKRQTFLTGAGPTIMSRIYRISGVTDTNVGVEMPSNTAISTVFANFNRNPNNKLLVSCADTANLRAMPANSRAASARVRLVTTHNGGNHASLCFWISLADALIAMSPHCGADRNALSLKLLEAAKAYMTEPIVLAHAVDLVLRGRRFESRNRSAKCAAAQIIRSTCALAKSASDATEAAIAAYFPDARDRELMGDDDARWKHVSVSELVGDLVGEFKIFSGTVSDEARDAVQSSKSAGISKDAAIEALLSIPRSVKAGEESGHQGAMLASRMLSCAGIAGVSLITNSYDRFRVEALAPPRSSGGAIIIVRGTTKHFEFVSSWDVSHVVVAGPDMTAMIAGIESSWGIVEHQQRWQAAHASKSDSPPALPSSAATTASTASTATEASVLARAKSLGPGSLLTHIDAVLALGLKGVKEHCMQGGMCQEPKCHKIRSHKKLGPRGVKSPRARRIGVANARASDSQQQAAQHSGSHSSGRMRRGRQSSSAAAGSHDTASSAAAASPAAAALTASAASTAAAASTATAAPSAAASSLAATTSAPPLPQSPPSQSSLHKRQLSQQVEQHGAMMQQLQYALQPAGASTAADAARPAG